MFTIIGSGFGLYGYLPALIESFGERVMLPEKYRPIVEARPELQKFKSAIDWVASSDAACKSATGLVIATRPTEQPEIAIRCCQFPGIATLVLEKPLAPTPMKATKLLSDLHACGKRYRVGYTFRYATWAATLDFRSLAQCVSIEWTFMAHHFANGIATWKRRHVDGGGVIRFFGIHLLALLAGQGYRKVTRSSVSGQVAGEPERWRATFTGPDLPICHVDLNTRSIENRFHVNLNATGKDQLLVDLREPFELEATGAGQDSDRRVGVLIRLLDSFHANDSTHSMLYAATNDLWQQAEATCFLAANRSGERDSPPV